MIGCAPASAAPITTESPTPPQPITTTDEPGSTWAVLTTAPTPVVTEQPIRQATSNGTLGEMGTTAEAGTTAASAKVPTERYW